MTNGPSLKTLEKQVKRFNQEFKVGDKVQVRKDDGSIIHTMIRGQAYVLGGHSAVAFLHDISGCYSIERIAREPA